MPNCFRDGVDEVLDFQWDVVQRQDVGIGLVEPASAQVQHLFRQLPGVVAVEPFRYASVRISFGHQRRQWPSRACPPADCTTASSMTTDHQIQLPPEGMVVSAKLAEVLGARVGDELWSKSSKATPRPHRPPGRPGRGLRRRRRLHGPAALNRLLGEGDVITGASFRVDAARRAEFLRALKGIPRVSWVAVKESLRANFRQTTAASINLIQRST